MADSIALFRRRKPRVDPDDAEDLARSLRDLWRRLGPRRNRDPVPIPPPQADTVPEPETEEPPPPDPDRRTGACVGDCEEDENCPIKTFCFNKGRFTGTPKDGLYDAQLRVQEATMRTMSSGELLGNRANYETLTRSVLERMPDVKSARDRVIDSWETRNKGQDWRAQGLQALHRLDMGAGGAPTGYYGMGDASINQSIGGSWPSKIT